MIQSGGVRYHDDLEHNLVPIEKIHRHPENYNRGDVEAVAESIEVNGMYRPVFVQKSTGYIIAGNHTYEACVYLGATQIPVVLLDVTDTEAYRIMIADNRIASMAMPDNNGLVNILAKLTVDEKGLAGTGVTTDDFTVLQKLAEMEPAYDEFGTWPTLTFTIHPRIKTAFMHMTREADTDPDRLELIMRLAGWDGS